MQSESPYGVGFAVSPSLQDKSIPNQVKKYSEEERGHKAPDTLGAPLQTITDIFGNAFVNLTQARSLLQQATHNPAIDNNAIERIITKIDNINKQLLEIPVDLEELSI